MPGMKKTILLCCLLISFFSSYAQVNPVIIIQDTTLDYTADCFTNFFKRAKKVTSLNKTILIAKNGKTTSLSSFIKTETTRDVQYGLIDLDKDGKMELVIYDYSGGAHCCDVFNIYKYISPDKYQFAGKTFAGNVCVTDDNEFVYDFNEPYGYFFTCYGCSYEVEIDNALNPVHNIFLKFNKGKLSVVPGDDELKDQINNYLEKLSGKPYEKLNTDMEHDSGLRKEFAFHLAVYYFSFGRNLPRTKILFDKYYKFPDAKMVWSKFVNILSEIKLDNDF